MNVIPVIDIVRGQVVRAVQGQRQSYLPVVSSLCKSSDPVTVARILCAHCAARQLYVADLDALMGGGAQTDVLRAVGQALPSVDIWVDAGFSGRQAACDLLASLHAAPGAAQAPRSHRTGRWMAVYGSETLVSSDVLAPAHAPYSFASGQAILSLDQLGVQAVPGAPGVQRLGKDWWARPDSWPSKVIVMTLASVGAKQGPDLGTLSALQQQRPDVQWVGAGGIRHVADLAQAQAAGAHAWLVASALHDGGIAPLG